MKMIHEPSKQSLPAFIKLFKNSSKKKTTADTKEKDQKQQFNKFNGES